MIERENWRDVPGWPEYAVSDLGRVKRVMPSKNGRARVGEIRKPVIVSGYLAVTVSAQGRGRKLLLVHRLVALAFLGEPPRPDMEVNHKDANRKNARLDNLEWVTKSQNRKHGYDFGFALAEGEANGHSKLTDAEVVEIRLLASHDRTNFPELAERFNVSKATIYDVVAGRTWQHLLAA